MKKISTLFMLLVLFALQATAQSTSEPTTFAEHIDFTKYYTISTPSRGGFAVNANNLISTNVERGVTGQQEGTENAQVEESDPNDPYQTFQFIPDPNDETKVYLYAPAVAKYVGKTGALQSKMENADPIYLFMLTNDYPDYPYGLSFNQGAFNLVPQINNYYTIVINGWGNPDAGNSLKFTEANFSKDDALETQRQTAADQVNTFGLLTNIFTTEDIDNALDAVDAATSTKELQQVIINLKKALGGKDISLYSNESEETRSGMRPMGYMNDNGSTLVNDSLSFSADFQLLYNDTTDSWALKNAYTGRYLTRIPQSTNATLDDTPHYTFKFIIQGNNLVSIGGPATMEYIHNGRKGTGIVGWSSDGDDSRWIINAFDGETASQNALAYVNSHITNHWGDFADTENFKSLKSAFEANPTVENYKAILASPDVVSGDAFVNIHSTAKNDNADYTNLSISLAQVQNDQINDSTYQHIQALDRDIEDPFQIWKVTSVKFGFVRLYSPEAKKYIGPNVNYAYNSISLVDDPVDWQIIWVDDTTFQLRNNNDYLNIQDGEQYFGNLNHWHGRDTWTATPVTSLPLTASNYGDNAYTSVCYPFELTLDNGTAYKAKVADDGKTVNLVSLGSTIPAGVPAIIKTSSDARDITATINGLETSKEVNEEGYIKGTYFPLNVSRTDNILPFGQQDGVPGFYHANRIIINGAYLESDGSQDAVTLGDVVTAINKIQNDEISENAPRYNLAGQRVDKNYKGVVIVKGKKIIQK